MMRRTLSIPAVCLVLAAHAQQVRITGWDAIRAGADAMKGRAAREALGTSGLPDDQQALVLSNSEPAFWPSALLADSSRKASAPYIANYAAFRIFSFTEGPDTLVVVQVPAKDNIHMPEELRPTADLFLVVAASGVQEVVAAKPPPEISRGPRWKGRAEATITRPEALFATYMLADDAAGMQALTDAGLSSAEIDAVVFRSHERNWPDGIDSFNERATHIARFVKYKACVAASWDDKVVLIIPVERNRKLPRSMRPYVDIYMVYARDAITIRTPRRK